MRILFKNYIKKDVRDFVFVLIPTLKYTKTLFGQSISFHWLTFIVTLIIYPERYDYKKMFKSSDVIYISIVMFLMTLLTIRTIMGAITQQSLVTYWVISFSVILIAILFLEILYYREEHFTNNSS